MSRTTPFKLDYSPSAPPLKVTRLVAQREDRIEPISYWMRIGYDNSNSNWTRQMLKLGYGLRGWVPDGALFRVSTSAFRPNKASRSRTNSFAIF